MCFGLDFQSRAGAYRMNQHLDKMLITWSLATIWWALTSPSTLIFYRIVLYMGPRVHHFIVEIQDPKTHCMSSPGSYGHPMGHLLAGRACALFWGHVEDLNRPRSSILRPSATRGCTSLVSRRTGRGIASPSPASWAFDPSFRGLDWGAAPDLCWTLPS